MKELSLVAKSLASSVRALLQGDTRAEARRVQSLAQELVDLIPAPAVRSLVGHSPAWRRVMQAIEHAARQTEPLFFWGEPGTGKTAAAKALFELAGSPAPVILDVESTPASIVDRAVAKPGPLILKNVRRPLSRKRTILTSRKNIEELRPVAVFFPPLRDRREDIPVLLYYFLKKHVGFDRPALERLLRYSYPGNVAELQSIVERAALVAEGPLVSLYDLPEELRQGTAPSPATVRTAGELRLAKREARETIERHFLVDALRRSGGKVTQAAKETGVHRTRLAQLMTKFKIRLSDFRPKK